jgi:hypothetical protein
MMKRFRENYLNWWYQLILVKILVPIMVRIMDDQKQEDYTEIYKTLFDSLTQTIEKIEGGGLYGWLRRILRLKKCYDGLFICVITPEAFDATLKNYIEEEYEELKTKMYQLAGITPKETDSQNKALPMSIDPRSFDYLELYKGGSSLDPDFYAKHGRTNNEWHDGALVYVYDPKTQQLRLVAVSVFLYPQPELFKIRSDGKVRGGRYQVAEEISCYEGVIATGIIETNGGNGYTPHIFANGEEITDYVRKLYQQR